MRGAVVPLLPFLAAHFCTGPLVGPPGGADVPWTVGLVVPAAVYWLPGRRDTSHVPAETRYAPAPSK